MILIEIMATEFKDLGCLSCAVCVKMEFWNGVFFIVNKRDRDTLLPIIIQEIEPESTVHSDEWRAYSTLKNHGFLHQTVNHSKN